MQEPSYSSLLQIPSTDDDLIIFEELRPAVKHTTFDQHYEATYYDSSLENPSSSGLYKTDLVSTPQSSDVHEYSEVDTTVSCGSRKRKPCLKQNHSEIEKRRRDKMNTYITELSSMIPMCSAMSKKLDKITVLRMAVEYLKTIQGPAHSYTETHYKPPFMSDQELKQSILQELVVWIQRQEFCIRILRANYRKLLNRSNSRPLDSCFDLIRYPQQRTLDIEVAEGFLFVVGCDRGKILYISESVSQILHFSQNDLLSQSLFDILHPKDVAKVKEQLSSSEHNPRERLLGSKISRLCSGARRSFFCRMKCNVAAQVKDKSCTTTDGQKRRESENLERKYTVVHCTGYLKSWSPTKIGLGEQDCDIDGESYNVSCLIALGRILPHISTITAATQSRINTKPLQFISKHSLDGKFLFVDQRVTLVLGFLPQELLGCSMYEYFHHEDIPALADSHKAVLQSLDKLFTKTYRFKTKDGEFVNIQSELRAFKNPWTKEIEYLISKNNLIIDFERVENEGPRTERLENLDFENEKDQVTENHDDGMIKLMEDVTTKSSINKQQSDGNDEAAMAIIMSLLEVDAGLGGPVDFSGLPWPLP